MKMKKVLVAALTIAALATSTSAFAASTATYDADTATASLTLKDGDVTGAGGQMTVAVVPKNFDGSAAQIYYINQGDFATEFANIIANMGLKGDINPADYEVRIGGENLSTPVTFAFNAQGQVIYGDADGDTAITTGDASKILQYISDPETEIKLPDADADGDSAITTGDASKVLQYISDPSTPLGPQN